MARSLTIKQELHHLGQFLLERDKQQHFAVCLALLLAFWPLTGSALVASALTMLVGLGKEIWDGLWGSGFCWLDMTANALGVLAGLATGWGVLAAAEPFLSV